MPELSVRERLQPALLDRLTDERPDLARESREQRVVSARQLRQAVRRDLVWLFNTASLDELVALADYPRVAQSVLNYGVPGLTGATVAGTDALALERRLRRIIECYEPRIIKESLRLTVRVGEHGPVPALAIELICDVWAQPVPERLYLKTAIDLELGSVTTIDERGG